MLLKLGASQARTDAEFAAVLTALGAKLGNSRRGPRLLGQGPVLRHDRDVIADACAKIRVRK
ncbi:hypothetical protein OG896_09000 [Streptomyces sp. NBC_00669]|uniref:hypothetical protein n=1 Tax=Streptomyces sp. NBC_00669 TaxID=2976011 RepID=UPI002E335DB4|nr:hypothetical protein [Streptomyces sp. NBC_00669]